MSRRNHARIPIAAAAAALLLMALLPVAPAFPVPATSDLGLDGPPSRPGGGRVGDQPPVADAGQDRAGSVGTTFLLDASGSTDPDGDALTAVWDFDRDDGIQQDSAGLMVTHAYLEAGSFVATVTVTDGRFSDVDSVKVEVVPQGQNVPPVAVIAAPTDGQAVNLSEPVRFSSLGSSDADGDTLRYRWDLGDGTVIEGPEVDHSYQTPFIYGVTLAVDDGQATSIASLTLVVDPTGGGIRPDARFVRPPAPLYAYHPAVFDASPTTDPDSADLRYAWDFDRSDGLGGANELSPSPSIGHAFAGPGPATVTLVVQDSTGLADFAVESFDVLPHPLPLVDAGPDRAVQVGVPVQYAASVVIPPTLAVLGDAPRTASWDFDGDGREDWTGQAGLPATHAFGGVRSEPYRARYTVTMDHDLQSWDDVLITVLPPENQPPTADAGLDRRVAVGAEVLLRDAGTDPDGAILEYAWDLDGDGRSDVVHTLAGTVRTSFAVPGSVVLTLSVTDDGGARASDSALLEVVDNRAPSVTILP